MTPEPRLASLWEAMADTVGDLPAVSQGSLVRSWSDYDERAARLATALADAGLKHSSSVGLYLYNRPEYLEGQYAAFKIGAVPVNVNFRYVGAELGHLLADADAEALIFATELADRVADVKDRLPSVRVWIEVGIDAPVREWALRYDDLMAQCAPLPRRRGDDPGIYMIYTGGTTGLPKGVVYDMAELTRTYVRSAAAALGEDTADLAWAPATARRLASAECRFTVLTACPLMHGAGMWAGVFLPHAVGGHVVLPRRDSLDADDVWDSVERHGVDTLVIVGDAFARPLVRALDRNPERWDLSTVRAVVSGGAALSAESKQALLDRLPDGAVVAESVGASEGIMGTSVSRRGTATATGTFRPGPHTRVLTEDGRIVRPGSQEIGYLAVAATGLVPLRYHKDPERSVRLLREYDGVRYSIPGDLARVEADGSILLLGRGSSVINSGGEKVYPEEVERVLTAHPDVDDCLVFGVPSETFGEQVVGVVSLVDDAEAGPEELIAWTKGRLAGFKAPTALEVVARVPRMPSGKADYPAARTHFAQADLT